VIRDFRIDVAPLIFSKPVSRAQYLLGKFFGNFFVLMCCQAAFVLTLFVLQAFRRPGMVVMDARAFPYLKHFLVLVVISHLVLAAFYFTVGTLTRNAKIVYGLGVSFYPLYITYQVAILKSLPGRWGIILDPLVMNWRNVHAYTASAEVLNQLVIAYDASLIANRALMILVSAICLTILYFRFTIAERPGKIEEFSTLNISNSSEKVYYDADSLPALRRNKLEEFDFAEKEKPRIIRLPVITQANDGIRANVYKLIAALGVELRLLRTERSLVVLIPLAIFFSTLELAFYQVVPDVSYSATYASSAARTLLLFLVGMTVFYTGEAMHRERELRIEPVLWAAPAPNNVLLLSKYFSTLLLTLSLVVLVGLTSIVIQFLRGHTPVEVSSYLTVFTVILFPSAAFMTAASIALNVVVRDKYLAYAVSIATGVGLFYLYSQGHNHWLHNPLLYQLWNYADLTGAGSNQVTILMHRIYCLAIAIACLSFALLFFKRKSTKRFLVDGRLGGAGLAILITVVSVAVAVIAGLTIVARN
jgi:ABC-type transport system involved in multi-copper enzyme maturation permease subunit